MSEKYNIHLFSDEKFVSGAVLQFEQYYPQRNIYIVNAFSEIDYTLPPEIKKCIYFFNFEKAACVINIKELARRNEVYNIFIHYLDYLKAGIVLRLKKEIKCRIYWIFYGSDLYSQIINQFNFFDYPPLAAQRGQHIFEKKIHGLKYFLRHRMTGSQAVRRVIEKMDYFCFWNPDEFTQLKTYYHTKAEFRPFIYTSALNYDEETEAVSKSRNIILVNHSASKWANHFTLLEKIGLLPEYNLIDEIILPLNYGQDSIKQKVINYCETVNMRNVRYITNFLLPEIYFQQLRNVSVAFFGAKRQEGAGNIFYLLKTGAKVFLRAENPMLPFLKKCGFSVFCFEEDLDKKGSILPLSKEEVNHNMDIYLRIFNKKTISEFMYNLIHTAQQ